jgi:hypothetical protein
VRQLKIRPLTAERAAQAFPLIQIALPEVTPAVWRAFATAQMVGGAARDGGILAVTDGRNYITGLCSYRVIPDLVHGRLLDARHFLAFDLLDRSLVAETLAVGIESLARERGCGAVPTQLPHRYDALPGPDDDMAELLAARGHRVETQCLCKPLTAYGRAVRRLL